jgi:hypothetical protein
MAEVRQRETELRVTLGFREEEVRGCVRLRAAVGCCVLLRVAVCCCVFLWLFGCGWVCVAIAVASWLCVFGSGLHACMWDRSLVNALANETPWTRYRPENPRRSGVL